MKKALTFILVFSVILCITVSAKENIEKNAEVVVEVLTNDYDEEYIKNIEFDDGTKVGDYNYVIKYAEKVTRDPVYINYYFTAAMWITRDGVVSLSLAPTQRVRDSATLRESGWNLLKNPSIGQGGSAHWPKTTDAQNCFYWQYLCHWEFANTKEYWNIEPSRTASNYTSVILHGCNP